MTLRARDARRSARRFDAPLRRAAPAPGAALHLALRKGYN